MHRTWSNVQRATYTAKCNVAEPFEGRHPSGCPVGHRVPCLHAVMRRLISCVALGTLRRWRTPAGLGSARLGSARLGLARRAPRTTNRLCAKHDTLHCKIWSGPLCVTAGSASSEQPSACVREVRAGLKRRMRCASKTRAHARTAMCVCGRRMSLSGGGVCGKACENYCAAGLRMCADEQRWVSQHRTIPLEHRIASHRVRHSRSCSLSWVRFVFVSSLPRRLYDWAQNMDDCLKRCYLMDTSGSPAHDTGDTFQCRITSLVSDPPHFAGLVNPRRQTRARNVVTAILSDAARALRQVQSRYSADYCASAHYLPSERSACTGLAPTTELQPDLSGAICSAQPEVSERSARYVALWLPCIAARCAIMPSRTHAFPPARTGQTYIGAACARACVCTHVRVCVLACRQLLWPSPWPAVSASLRPSN